MNASSQNDRHADQHDHSSNQQQEQSENDLADDVQLDALLLQARWPEAEAAVLARLQKSIAAGLLDYPVIIEAAQTIDSMEAPVPDNKSITMRTDSGRSGRGSVWMLLTSTLAVAVLAFFAGRWSSSNNQLTQDTASPPLHSQPSAISGQPSESPGRLPGATPSNGVDASRLADSDNKQMNREPLDPSFHQPAQSTSQPPAGHPQSTDLQSPDQMLAETQPAAMENSTLQPEPDPLNNKRHRLTQREKMQLQLESVLTCLARQEKVDPSCCRSLLPRRAEFEYMLGEVIRNATGQRQLAAVTAIGFIGTDGSVPGLLRTSATDELRVAAVEAAKRCASEQMLAGLILQTGDAKLQLEFLTELAQRNTDRAVLAWLHLMRSPATRNLCQQAADRLSPTMIDAMFVNLDAPLLDDRIAAIQTLGWRTDLPTQNRILRTLQQFPNRWEPVAILMWNGSEPALKTLVNLQRNPEQFAVLQTAAIQLEAAVGGTSSGTAARTDHRP